MARRFDALIFDFDGSILDTEVPLFEAWVQVYADHGHELELDTWRPALGTRDAFDPVIDLAQRCGMELDRDALWAVVDVANRAGVEAQSVRRGIVAWLEAAADLDIPVAIASSSSTRENWVDGHLTRLGLRDHFVHLECWFEGIEPKPAPDLYLRAASALGVDPGRCLAVEDSPNGLKAAIAAGITCVVSPNPLTAGMDFTGALHVVDHLDELDLRELATH